MDRGGGGYGPNLREVGNRGREVRLRYVGEQWEMWPWLHHGAGSNIWGLFRW